MKKVSSVYSFLMPLLIIIGDEEEEEDEDEDEMEEEVMYEPEFEGKSIKSAR